MLFLVYTYVQRCYETFIIEAGSGTHLVQIGEDVFN